MEMMKNKENKELFHVVHKVPSGDGPYVRAKHAQLVEKEPEAAIVWFWKAINGGDRVDSALKDMCVVMKQLHRTEEAIEAIHSFRSLCSQQAQESLDNVLLDLLKAIGKFRVDLSQYEAKLQKVLGERDDLRLLCSKKEEAIKDLQADLAKVREERVELDQQVSLVLLKYGFDSTVEVNPPLSQLQQKIEKIGLLREEVDQIRAECNQWKETIDRLAAEKETILTKLLSADVQLRNVKQKVSVQAKKIDELEIQLAEAKAEVESSKVLADKSIAVYRADAEAAQVEAREAAKIAMLELIGLPNLLSVDLGGRPSRRFMLEVSILSKRNLEK
ncbi:uncharacterized protein LOC107794032 isoform X2 [Nicotiana tabacum]|uniref:Uncharacterized protein LOC107794032 isoform X2 n=1 Tax=Nicotiana tabacum TaxID=4097 RepID=A0AC58T9C4_TOBAC